MGKRDIVEGDLGFQRRAMRQGDLIHQKTICEPDINDVTWTSRVGNPPRGSVAENAIAWDIVALLESFEPQAEGSNYRSLWFRVPRGEIDDWMSVEEYRDYAEMYDDADKDVEAAWRKEWAEWFPDEYYWHTLGANQDNGWAIIAVDGGAVIEVRPGETHPTRIRA